MPERELYTLTELSKKSGISMPTLQRYKKLYQDRIPSEGTGRTQKFPREAIAVVREIKRENVKRRGGGKRAKAVRTGRKKTTRKTASKAAPRKRRSGARSRRQKAAAGEMLSLAEIGRRTGISYPTLIKYVKQHGDKIPHHGKGRSRRFPPQAVAVFRKIRGASRRGRRRGAVAATAPRQAAVTDAALAARVKKLERAQRDVARQLEAVIRLLKKPMQVTIRPR